MADLTDRPTWLIISVVILATIPVGATAGAASPQPPESYYGSVSINGQPAPEGVEIVARIAGELRGNITVKEAGSYGGPGAFEEKLTVNGSDGEEVRFYVAGLDTTTTDVLNPGDVTHLNLSASDEEPPTASAGSDITAAPGESVQFDASGSNDNGAIVRYDWAFGDGTTATGVSPTHTYDTAGSYDVTLTVTDAGGNTDQDTLTVTIESESDDDGGDDSGGGSGGTGGAGGGGAGASTPTPSPTPTASPTPTPTPTPSPSGDEPTATARSPTPTAVDTPTGGTETQPSTTTARTTRTGEGNETTAEATLIPVNTTTMARTTTETPGQPGFGHLASALAALTMIILFRRRSH